MRSKALLRAGLVVAAAGLATAALGAARAGASQLIDRNATNVTLQVNDRGEALLTYTAHGEVRHVLAWGAVNALPPTEGADWSWHRWDHLYGQLTYLGQPAFGFLSSSLGNPLDGFGRNVYVDTDDSAYGPGWRRENSALTHRGTGVFCYSVNPHGDHPAGKGSAYRVTVIGPGVTPDLMWRGPAPGPYSPSADAAADEQIAALHDSLCQAN